MAFLLDTNVLIDLRDGAPEISDRIAALDDAVLMSMISRVELEGGVYRNPGDTHVRRSRLDLLLMAIPTLDFDEPAAKAYGAIVAAAGYSRRKLLDRMIAAQAVVHKATLVTRNPSDFSDIPGLSLLRL